jgi:hypothetical protein
MKRLTVEARKQVIKGMLEMLTDGNWECVKQAKDWPVSEVTEYVDTVLNDYLDNGFYEETVPQLTESHIPGLAKETVYLYKRLIG